MITLNGRTAAELISMVDNLPPAESTPLLREFASRLQNALDERDGLQDDIDTWESKE